MYSPSPHTCCLNPSLHLCLPSRWPSGLGVSTGPQGPQGVCSSGLRTAPFVWLRLELRLLLTTPNAFSPPDSILSEAAGAPLVEVRSASC